MTTKELRIGNYVFDHKHSWISKVAEIDEIGITTDNEYSRLQQEIENYEPIPLNEEWFLKFGFEKQAYSWIGKVFNLTEWDDFPLHWSVAMNKNNAVIFSKLKYVHQLQKLRLLR